MGMSVGPAGGGKGKAPPPNVNITPLVDVVLVLLIIFMVMTPLMVKHFGFNLPEKEEGDKSSAPAPSAGQPTALVLVIKDNGELVLNNKTFPNKEALAAQLSVAFVKRKDNSMFIDASDKVSYGIVAETMDACRGAGAKSIAFVTEHNKNATLQ